MPVSRDYRIVWPKKSRVPGTGLLQPAQWSRPLQTSCIWSVRLCIYLPCRCAVNDENNIWKRYEKRRIAGLDSVCRVRGGGIAVFSLCKLLALRWPRRRIMAAERSHRTVQGVNIEYGLKFVDISSSYTFSRLSDEIWRSLRAVDILRLN